MSSPNTSSRLVYTGPNAYQLFWSGRGHIIRSGGETPVLPMHECLRLLGTGFFAASGSVWQSIMATNRENPDPASLNGMWNGKRCFLIGGGPSLKGFDLSRLNDEETIAVNHSFDFYPQAKAVCFVDKAYAEIVKERIKDYKGMIFASFRCREILKRQKNLYIFPQNNTRPGSSIGEGLYSGRLSGLCAMNMALILGAEEIYLLGYDMNYSGKDHHWYGTAHPNQEKYDEANFTRKIKMFDAYRPFGDRIFNCSSSSAVTHFQYRDLEKVLSRKTVVPRSEKEQSIEFVRSRINRETHSSSPVYPVSTMDKLEKINGMLEGKRVFVIGSGPSLKGFDFSLLKNEETIAVNHTLEHYKDAKYHLFGDPRVYDYVKDIYKDYKGMIFASHHADLEKIEREDDRMIVFSKNWKRVTEKMEDGLYSDFNSGMEAVNLALVMGAKEIYLLGLDFCANDGEYYFYGRPKWYTQNVDGVDSLLKKRVQFWDNFKPYADRIFNCSPISRIKVFPYKSIEEVLNVNADRTVA